MFGEIDGKNLRLLGGVVGVGGDGDFLVAVKIVLVFVDPVAEQDAAGAGRNRPEQNPISRQPVCPGERSLRIPPL